MLIDWFTVGAQILNFIILVWLMKRFLYQPILDAIDAREKKIADKLASAEQISQQASQAKASFESKNLEFDQQRNQLMADAGAEANTERQRLLEEARQLAAQFASKQQQALQQKMQNLHDSIRTATQKEVFAITKKALRDLAAVDIETQMIAVFLHQLQTVTSEQKVTLQTALTANHISVLSSSALSTDQQSTIEASVKELLLGEALDHNAPDNKKENHEVKLRFEQSADLVAGIELTANGFKIGWSVAEYIKSLEDALADEINKHRTTDGTANTTIAVTTDLAGDNTPEHKTAVNEQAP